MSKKQMNNEAGFMGLEGMGALLFYLVMLAGAALLVVQLFSGGKLSEMEKSLSALRMSIQQLYTAQGNYGEANEDMTATIAEAGILPAGFRYDATAKTVASPWNTAVTITSQVSSFEVTVDDVPADDCVKFAMYDLDAWHSIAVNETVIAGMDGDTPVASDYTVKAANTACAGKPATFKFTAN